MSHDRNFIPDDFTRELRIPRPPDLWLSFFACGGDEVACLAYVRAAVRYLRTITVNAEKRNLLTSHALANAINKVLQEHLKLTSGSSTVKEIKSYLSVKNIPASVSERRIRSYISDLQSELASHESEAPLLGRRIPAICALILVRYLIDFDLLATTGQAESGYKSEQMLAEALMMFFASSRSTKTELPPRLQGWYFIYRKSLHWPGRIVKGSLFVDAVPLLDSLGQERTPMECVLCTKENHYYRDSATKMEVREIYTGMISRKAGHIYMFSTPSGMSGKERGAPRFTLMSSVVSEFGIKGMINSMSGITLSISGSSHILSSPVCIERSLEPIQEQALGLFDSSECDLSGNNRIPQSVVARLESLQRQVSEA